MSNDSDKGYDAEYNHKYVNEAMKSIDHIKLRNKDIAVRMTMGACRKKEIAMGIFSID